MTEQQKKAAEQALANYYSAACRIEDSEPLRMVDDAFWVLVNRPNRVNIIVIMVEAVQGVWHIAEVPWT